MPVIIAKDLYKCYPGFAPVLRGVNIEVEPGEMAAIMGPSGCGKSTMLHVLGMLHAPDSGSLEILNTDVLKLNAEQTAAFRRGNMGFVMQASNLFEHSTVFENVEFPLIYENVPPQERWERVIRALELVHLSARVHYRSNRLSGGEQQRVAIARAMVNNPRILLADEPTGALDARTSRLIMENFRRLCHAGGVAMIMVTHDPKMAEYCDSIYTLDDGILHCKKHEPTPFKASTGENFLRPPEPIVRGALVAARFPGHDQINLLEFARQMQIGRLISRIYSLAHATFLGNPEGYALPLPVRHIGYWQLWGNCFRFFAHARHLPSLWQLWHRLPHTQGGIWRRIRQFAASRILMHWCHDDKIEFIYAADANESATSAWAAANLTGLPYAMAVNPVDVGKSGRDWPIKIKDATFASCPTLAVKKMLLSKWPDLDAEKILVLRPGLPVSPDEDESEQQEAPNQKGKPFNILCMGANISAKGFTVALEAVELLKKSKTAFSLSILDEGSFHNKRLLRKHGLASQGKFLGEPKTDSLGDIFRTADIFISFPPDFDGGRLALPYYVCEAMAFGLGIVVTDLTDGMEEAIRDGQNALVTPAGDAAALSKAITSLAENPDLRHDLGKAARNDIKGLLNDGGAFKTIEDIMAAAAGLEESGQEQSASSDNGN